MGIRETVQNAKELREHARRAHDYMKSVDEQLGTLAEAFNENMTSIGDNFAELAQTLNGIEERLVEINDRVKNLQTKGRS